MTDIYSSQTHSFYRPVTALCALALALLLLPRVSAAESQQDILVVVNKGVGEQPVTLDELRAMFLKSRVKWADGKKVRPIHAFSTEQLRREFNAKVLRMSLEEETSYWEEKKIKQGVLKPPAHKDPLVPVGRDGGTVGYVYRKDFREGDYRILTVIPAPSDAAAR